MAEQPSAILFADVLRAANELVSNSFIRDYALGRALAAIYYTEPVTTYDADIIFIASDKTLSVGIPAIYSHLQFKGWRVAREHLLIKDFPVQFLAALDWPKKQCVTQNGSNMKAFRRKFFYRNNIIAIAASVGRHKDLARIEQLMTQVDIDKALLDDILRGYSLKLPNK